MGTRTDGPPRCERAHAIRVPGANHEPGAGAKAETALSSSTSGRREHGGGQERRPAHGTVGQGEGVVIGEGGPKDTEEREEGRGHPQGERPTGRKRIAFLFYDNVGMRTLGFQISRGMRGIN